jgi:hypothetical protein
VGHAGRYRVASRSPTAWPRSATNRSPPPTRPAAAPPTPPRRSFKQVFGDTIAYLALRADRRDRRRLLFRPAHRGADQRWNSPATARKPTSTPTAISCSTRKPATTEAVVWTVDAGATGVLDRRPREPRPHRHLQRRAGHRPGGRHHCPDQRVWPPWTTPTVGDPLGRPVRQGRAAGQLDERPDRRAGRRHRPRRCCAAAQADPGRWTSPPRRTRRWRPATPSASSSPTAATNST